jgi:L-threonylcarbamoyladenylate synthase
MLTRNVRTAVDVLETGGIIAYPTEGVWGLGCDPFDERAVNRLLQLKQRPVEKGLILVAASMEQIAALLAPLDEQQMALLRSGWPGPNTWLLPDPDQLVPAWIKGKFDTVAVRVSDHPLVQALCKGFGGPIVSTSANPGSKPPATSSVRVLTWFGDKIDFVVPGRLGGAKGPSSIRDLCSSQRIR